METLGSESATGTNSALEAGRRLGLPPFSIRNILHRVLNQSFKLQSFHELLPSDTTEREAFARWASSKIEQDSSWPDILYSAVAGFVTRLQCVILCGDVTRLQCVILCGDVTRLQCVILYGDGHVEHILL
ncbi:hypothetical protein NPIL_54331 [Nephila pilipes]|uniref:Uncharacterized protein n=1 Tax=Nephila pilipes TaxID=299642 RepID=A0A8X6IPL8_NEPPI|nr:hypothetical protein NPIL_54331 [Nephila pilipes]